jgi:HlyD family secretion protein
MDTRSSAATQARQSKHKRKSAISAKRLMVAIATVLALFALAWNLFVPEPLRVETTAVQQGPMQVTIDNQGQVRVHDKYVIAAPVAGTLERIDLHDGDPVKRNQILAILNPLPLDAKEKERAQAGLESAKALADEARLRAQRAETDMKLAVNESIRANKLGATGAISKEAAERANALEASRRAEWHAARSSEQAAIANVKAAKAALIDAEMPFGSAKRQLRMPTPVDGYVLKVHERSGRTVTAGTPLITVGNTDQYEIVVDVLSTDAVKVKPGDLILLEGWGGGRILRAAVRLVEPLAFTKISALGVEEQRVNVIGDPIDPLGPLGDGYRIEARIVIWSAERVTKVAGSSLFRVGNEWHVFAVEKGRAYERKVEIGERNQDEVQIVSGLAPGAHVVRYPSNDIQNGTRVIPVASRGGQ